MSSGRLTHATMRALDWLSGKTLPGSTGPAHQRIGRHGEEDAYFFLRKLGYLMVARNFRSPRRRGEIDLIGWDKDVLCFVEVKTRTTRDVKPAEAAVDRSKQRELAAVLASICTIYHLRASFGSTYLACIMKTNPGSRRSSYSRMPSLCRKITF